MENKARITSMSKGGFNNLFQYVLLAFIILSLLSLFACGGGGGGSSSNGTVDNGNTGETDTLVFASKTISAANGGDISFPDGTVLIIPSNALE